MNNLDTIIGVSIVAVFIGLIGYAIRLLSRPIEKKPKLTGRGGDFHD